MKRLMFLISTEGKTPQKISEEAKIAYQKYKQVETEQSKIADKKKT